METVHLEARDGIAYATLDRSAARNAIDERVLDGLDAVVEEVRSDTSLKALVISGAGEAFCIGLDIDLLRRAFGDPVYFRHILSRYRDVLLALEALPIPVIAAVNGLARAGGFEMILACDLVIASDEARIADHHLAFGIPPGGGATQRAPRRLGAQRASEMILTARWIDGREAAAIGLALRSVPRARLDEAVEELCAQLRGKARPALAVAKRMMRSGASLPLDQGVQLEIDLFMDYLQNEPTSRDGFNDYIEKRT